MIIQIVALSLITIFVTGIEFNSTSEAIAIPTFNQEETATEFTTTDKPTKTHEPHSFHEHEKHISQKSRNLKTESKHIRTESKSPKVLKIQYAPIPERFKKPTRKSQNVIAINVDTEGPIEETLKDVNIIKSNVAPYFDIQRHNYRSFVPGYKIDVFQSANRSPGHNAVYRSFPEIFERNKGYKITYMREHLDKNTPDPSITEIISTENLLLNVEDNMFKPNPAQTIELHRPNPPLVSKLHRIHLNLARVYNAGRVFPNIPIHDNDYNIHSVHRKKNLLPSFYPEVFEKKSQHLIEADENKEREFHFNLQ